MLEKMGTLLADAAEGCGIRKPPETILFRMELPLC
jgi:hypothetical protein